MNEKQIDDIKSKLDILIIIHLAKAGFSQKDIGKILGIGDNKIQKLFGKNYQKFSGVKNE